MKHTLIIGASNKTDRYTYKAFQSLQKHHHKVVLMHPTLKEIDQHMVYNQLSEITEPIDTITLYVNAGVSSSLSEGIIKLNPRRVIFNPGAENPELMQQLQAQEILCLDACTLVLLNTFQY